MNDTLANTEKKTAYILTLPAVLLVFSIILFPIFANIWISFKEVEPVSYTHLTLPTSPKV